MNFPLFLLLTLFCYSLANAQVGINTLNPRSTAVLELESEFGDGSFGGFMMPRLTSDNLNSLTTALTSNDEGMLVFVTDLREVRIWNGSLLQWEILFTFNNSSPVANSIVISGTVRVGETITGNYSFFDGDGDPEGTTTFQWYVADDAQGTNQSPIPNATNATFTLTADEVNRFIGLGITPIALRGTSPGEEIIFYNTTPVAEEIVLWINEIHYNNIGGDQNEGVEIAGTSGTDLTGYSILFYNGSNSSVYDQIPLNGIIPNVSNGLGVLNFAHPGIQNGDPDGIALVNNDGVVVQFLSYGGTITANGGAANGLTSIDIGLTETELTPLGVSIQLQGSGNRFSDFVWNANITATRGTINLGQIFN
ncbi:hypothetical protein GTQ40_06530 [Flavobacteriaceae bacterium R38]|nr:hypothetical protein [Flavobacteriaceae bacterium R38]